MMLFRDTWKDYIPEMTPNLVPGNSKIDITVHNFWFSHHDRTYFVLKSSLIHIQSSDKMLKLQITTVSKVNAKGNSDLILGQ
jgi:hypothetical protein